MSVRAQGALEDGEFMGKVVEVVTDNTLSLLHPNVRIGDSVLLWGVAPCGYTTLRAYGGEVGGRIIQHVYLHEIEPGLVYIAFTEAA